MARDMNDIIVTREMLVADSICIPAMEAFGEAFPDGSATLQEIVEHDLCKPKWLEWLAVFGSFISADIGMALISKTDNPKHGYGGAAIFAHWVTAETGPNLVMISGYPPSVSGYTAAFAHWVTAETGPDMIAKSDEPKRYLRLAIEHSKKRSKWMTPKIKAELIAKYGD